MVYSVPNIGTNYGDLRTKERKKNKREDKEVEKKTKADNIKDEIYQHTRVSEIATGSSGSRSTIIDVEGNGVMPATIVVDLVLADGMIAEDSRTRF